VLVLATEKFLKSQLLLQLFKEVKQFKLIGIDIITLEVSSDLHGHPLLILTLMHLLINELITLYVKIQEDVDLQILQTLLVPLME